MVYALIILGMLTRVIPHPANFTAVGAVGLLAGAYGPKRWFYVVPLASLFLTDIVIGFYSWQIMVSVYLSFIAASLLGAWGLRRHRSVGRIVFNALLSAIIFYLVSNFAVWAWSGLYAKNWTGLMQSYALALPFFRNSILGDLTYTLVLFGIFEYYQIVKREKIMNLVLAKGG